MLLLPPLYARPAEPLSLQELIRMYILLWIMQRLNLLVIFTSRNTCKRQVIKQPSLENGIWGKKRHQTIPARVLTTGRALRDRGYITILPLILMAGRYTIATLLILLTY